MSHCIKYRLHCWLLSLWIPARYQMPVVIHGQSHRFSESVVIGHCMSVLCFTHRQQLCCCVPSCLPVIMAQDNLHRWIHGNCLTRWRSSSETKGGENSDWTQSCRGNMWMQECGHCSCLRIYSHAAREWSEGELTDINEGNRCDKRMEMSQRKWQWQDVHIKELCDIL